MKNDNVNHPAHYNHDGIETIDVIKAWTKDLKPFEAYCMGNAIKYVSRWKDKNGIEDLKKARWYLNRVIGDEAESGIPEKKKEEVWEQLYADQMQHMQMMANKIDRDGYLFWNDAQWEQIKEAYGDLLRNDYDFCMRSLRNCIPKEKNSETETLDKSSAIKAFCKNELSIVFTADDDVAIADKMLDCIKYLDTDGCRREHLIIELLGYLTQHPTAWKNKWSIVISLAGCRPDGKWIDICVAQDDFRDYPTINDKPYYIWPSEED